MNFIDLNSPFANYQIFDKTYVAENKNSRLNYLNFPNSSCFSLNEKDEYNFNIVNDTLILENQMKIKLHDNKLTDENNNVFYESPLAYRHFICEWTVDEVFHFH